MSVDCPFHIAILNKRVDVVLDARTWTKTNRNSHLFSGRSGAMALHIPDEELKNT